MSAAPLTVRFAGDAFEVAPDARFRVGRGDDTDLVVAVPDVSRHHAVFSYAEGWWVEDEHSANGTWVDGRRIQGRTRITGASIVRLA